MQKKVERILRKSVEYAFENREDSAEYVKLHSQEMTKEVVDAHINLYVNEFSVSLGSQGREAIVKVFDYCNISSTNIFVK